MPDNGKESVSRRSFLQVAGAIMAAIGGFSLKDIIQAETRNAIIDPTDVHLGMDVRSATEIQRIATKYYADEQWYLRLGVQGNENSGYQVCMGIDQDPVEGEDITALVQQVPVLVQRDCLRILSGTRIVFGERSGQRGFIFEGPLFDRSSRKG